MKEVIVGLVIIWMFIRFIKYSIQRGKDKEYEPRNMTIEASVKRKIKSLEKEDIKDKNKFINKFKNINGKTLILIGVLIPIILLLLFGESYSHPRYYKSYVEYLVKNLTSANLVFYDELQVPISVILALALGIIGIGIYKLINKPED